jgi:uncharacterized MAPEG superfamily protein
MDQLTNVYFPENLYLLSRMFSGFKLLYQKLGSFKVTKHLVCINEEGIVKVWSNANLAKWKPEPREGRERPGRDARRTPRKAENKEESVMVWEIIKMVEKITDNNLKKGELTFTAFVKKSLSYHLCFKKAMELLRGYANTMKTEIP